MNKEHELVIGMRCNIDIDIGEGNQHFTCTGTFKKFFSKSQIFDIVKNAKF